MYRYTEEFAGLLYYYEQIAKSTYSPNIVIIMLLSHTYIILVDEINFEIIF